MHTARPCRTVSASSPWHRRKARHIAHPIATPPSALINSSTPARTDEPPANAITAAPRDITVVRDARYVVEGNLLRSQGVSAGIDMALWLIGHLSGRDHARAVMNGIQYEPAPPYLADELF